MVGKWLWHIKPRGSHCVLWIMLRWYLHLWSFAIQRENQRDRGGIESHPKATTTRAIEANQKASILTTIHEQFANYS